VSSGSGCSDSIAQTIVINPSPIASFTFTAGCQDQVAMFTSTSSANVVSWSWNFGDGNTSSVASPSNLYDSASVYSVVLTVTSDSGCTASVTQPVTIYPMPVAGFIVQTSCTSLDVSFTDTSSVASGTITSYSWNFGDGGTSAQQSPAYTYATSGTYTVTLIIQSSNGCLDTATSVVTTGTPVLADYIPHGGDYNVNQSISFTNQSTGAVTYIWNFGDGSPTSGSTDPTYSYGTPGTYSVLLIATNSGGCSDTVTYVFNINTQGYVVPTGFTPNGDGLNDYFYLIGNFSEYELRVFNEWGNQIFMSNDQSLKWDGKYKGTDQPAGRYEYIFIGKVVDGDELKLQGEINLIR
jgi:gliding motility-associated-like protein